jgi:hypothetical protein
MFKMNTMNLVQRMKSPTPNYFKILRNIGLGLAAAGGALLASPFHLPEIISSIGEYLMVGGSVASAVSQSTVDSESL